jgi:serine/threonine-protein kinase
VHRDIKPANLFLTSTDDARTRILDFGVSKFRPLSTTTSQTPLTTGSATLGSLNYMPPEQIGGAARVDARADLYALATVAFRALTGALPFALFAAPTQMRAKLNGPAPSLADVTAVPWPEPVENFFRRGLAREPDGRFDHAQAMLEAWVAAMQHDLPDRGSFRPLIPTEETSDTAKGMPTVVGR